MVRSSSCLHEQIVLERYSQAGHTALGFAANPTQLSAVPTRAQLGTRTIMPVIRADKV